MLSNLLFAIVHRGQHFFFLCVSCSYHMHRCWLPDGIWLTEGDGGDCRPFYRIYRMLLHNKMPGDALALMERRMAFLGHELVLGDMHLFCYITNSSICFVWAMPAMLFYTGCGGGEPTHQTAWLPEMLSQNSGRGILWQRHVALSLDSSWHAYSSIFSKFLWHLVLIKSSSSFPYFSTSF
jgi:hypothetical protein